MHTITSTFAGLKELDQLLKLVSENHRFLRGEESRVEEREERRWCTDFPTTSSVLLPHCLVCQADESVLRVKLVLLSAALGQSWALHQRKLCALIPGHDRANNSTLQCRETEGGGEREG